VEWHQFMLSVKHGAIRIKDKEDKLIWSKNNKSENYAAKLGYEARMEEEVEGNNKWWWKSIWKLNSPLKISRNYIAKLGYQHRMDDSVEIYMEVE
jgi:hypothetical protein